MKFSLLAIALLLTLTTFAQNQKGDWNISLSASPYPTEANGQKDFGFIALAGMEIFVSDHVSFGGSFFTSDTSTLKNDSGIARTGYGFVPSVQYYFTNKAKWNVYGHAGYGFGFGEDSRPNATSSALRVYSIGPGAHYVLNERVSLKLFLPYFNARNKTNEVNEADGVAVFIGAVFKL